MERNELGEIADELHNINLNLVELINVLKGRQSSNVGDDLDDTLDALGEAMKAHRDQLIARSAETTVAKMEAEDAYLKKQANFDQALKKLGVL